MLQNNCIIGGEGNGGVIDLRVVPVRDSLVGIVLTLQLLAETGKTVSELVAEIPSYSLLKTKFSCPLDKTSAVLDKVKKHYIAWASQDQVNIDTADGIRVDLPDGWVQLRASNTEPIMRIMAESTDHEVAKRLIRQVRDLAQI
ncbi:MAG: phosphoglucosamine mutase, partial [Planctomycetes bacterium]|nr:phosphoglucosamine mutase [Planctomycetota bacterium]